MTSAVVVHVPEAEPVVGGWRRAHTYDAPLGLPAHVTILYPFVPRGELTEAEPRLAELVAGHEACQLRLPTSLHLPHGASAVRGCS